MMSNIQLLFTLVGVALTVLGLAITILFQLLDRESRNTKLLSEVKIRVDFLIDNGNKSSIESRESIHEIKQRIEKLEMKVFWKQTIPPKSP